MNIRQDLIKNLFRAFAKGDRKRFISMAMILVSEVAERNPSLAGELKGILAPSSSSLMELPKTEGGAPLLKIDDTPVPKTFTLKSGIMRVLEAITVEHRKKDLLAPYGLTPRSKLLFYGEPGCGKTMAARMMAEVMGRPLLSLNLGEVFSSFLGTTGNNLNKVFDCLRSGGAHIVLIDEFDAIAKDRGDQQEVGEVKRIVSLLLTLIDSPVGDNIIIAASNHPQLLDSAIWRRFDEVVHFPPPNQEQVKSLILDLLAPVGFSGDLSWLSEFLVANKMSFADVERATQTALRKSILEGKQTISRQALEMEIGDYVQTRREAMGMGIDPTPGEGWDGG